MSNMSYCRFENTVSDLQDCQQALDNGVLETLDESERRSAERLIRICRSISDDHGDLDE